MKKGRAPWLTSPMDIPWEPTEIHRQDKITDEQHLELLNIANEERNPQVVKTRDARESDWWKCNSYFSYPGEKIMKQTLKHTTRMGKISSRIPFQLHHKSRNPLLQRTRLLEGHATDTIFSATASFEGYNAAQPFVGVKSKYRKIYGMKSESGGPDALLDFFRQEGVPLSIVRDNSKMQASQAWTDYCRRFWVEDKFIEPYHPEQNPLEREMAHWKNDCEKLMIDQNVIQEDGF